MLKTDMLDHLVDFMTAGKPRRWVRLKPATQMISIWNVLAEGQGVTPGRGGDWTPGPWVFTPLPWRDVRALDSLHSAEGGWATSHRQTILSRIGAPPIDSFTTIDRSPVATGAHIDGLGAQIHHANPDQIRTLTERWACGMMEEVIGGRIFKKSVGAMSNPYVRLSPIVTV
jgi:hypothetical protein